MLRIITLVILLSIFIGIHAGIIHHEPQANSVTRFEKRSTKIPISKASKGIKKPDKKKFDCSKANYKTVTLVDFVYTHECFPAGWKTFLALETVKKEISTISPKLANEAKYFEIEPPMPNMFRAFKVQRGNVKVVIIGQDPVPEANQATGLAFSLKPGTNPRDSVPTVFNMLVELKLEGMNNHLTNGDLSPWIKKGVLLLNAALTVRQGTSKVNAGSHQNMWNEFTQHLVKHINAEGQPTAWILWGDEAKKFAGKINRPKHFIKAGGHPSPQGGTAGIRFFGRNYFSCANDFLVKKGRGGVDWTLPPIARAGKQPGDCDKEGLLS